MNKVFGARLRIAALRASTDPGIELLQYIAPRDADLSPYTNTPMTGSTGRPYS